MAGSKEVKCTSSPSWGTLGTTSTASWSTVSGFARSPAPSDVGASRQPAKVAGAPRGPLAKRSGRSPSALLHLDGVFFGVAGPALLSSSPSCCRVCACLPAVQSKYVGTGHADTNKLCGLALQRADAVLCEHHPPPPRPHPSLPLLSVSLSRALSLSLSCLCVWPPTYRTPSPPRLCCTGGRKGRGARRVRGTA